MYPILKILDSAVEYLLIFSGSMFVTFLVRLHPQFMPILITINLLIFIATVIVAINGDKQAIALTAILKSAIVLGNLAGFYDLIEIIIRYDPNRLIIYIIFGLFSIAISLAGVYFSGNSSTKSEQYFEDDI